MSSYGGETMTNEETTLALINMHGPDIANWPDQIPEAQKRAAQEKLERENS